LNLFTGTGTRDAGATNSSIAGVTSVPAMLTYSVTIAAAGAILTVTPSTIVGGNAMDLFISQLPVTVLTLAQKEKLDIDVLSKRADDQDRKISDLIRLLTHCNSPTPSDPTCMEEEKSSELSSSIHIPRGILSKYMSQ